MATLSANTGGMGLDDDLDMPEFEVEEVKKVQPEPQIVKMEVDTP